jgi:hypothetical protein
MELTMSTLKTLNFVAAPKRNNDPIIQRRIKLIAQLRQQRALAEDASHVVTIQRWRKAEDGNKRLVERQKRVKAWWQVDATNQYVLVVRYGARILEFDQGKSAIAVGDKSNLVSVIDVVIAAVANGEMDKAIDVGVRNLRNAFTPA